MKKVIGFPPEEYLILDRSALPAGGDLNVPFTASLKRILVVNGGCRTIRRTHTLALVVEPRDAAIATADTSMRFSFEIRQVHE